MFSFLKNVHVSKHCSSFKIDSAVTKKSCFPIFFVFPNIVPLQTLFLERNRLGVDTETTSDHMCLVSSVRITYKCLFSVKKGVMIQLHST